MPAASKKPSALSSRMKSPRSPWARRPENDVMICRAGIFFTLRAAVSRTKSSPARVVAVNSLSSRSEAVGPSSRLPCTVGVTRMPLPSFDGIWKIVLETRPPAVLSHRQYSPARGVIVNACGSAMSCTASA